MHEHEYTPNPDGTQSCTCGRTQWFNPHTREWEEK